jgi:hypothetical protein
MLCAMQENYLPVRLRYIKWYAICEFPDTDVTSNRTCCWVPWVVQIETTLIQT